MTDKLVEALERDVEWLDRFGRSVHCTVEDNDTIQRVVAFARRALSSRPAGEAVAYAGLPMSDLDLTLHYEASKNGIVDLEPSEVRQIIGELRHLRAHPPAAVAGDDDEHELIERLLDAQQDINLVANQRMDQSLCDASALIDEIEPILRRALSAPRQPDGEAVREAVEGIADDYMTSETHHPGYVLIPTAKFEQILAALASTKAPDADGGAQITVQSGPCQHQWAHGATVGYYRCVKCGERHDHGSAMYKALSKAPDAQAPATSTLRPGQRVTLRPVEDGEIVPGGDHVIASIDDGPGGGFRVHGHPNVTIWPHRIVGREAREAKHG